MNPFTKAKFVTGLVAIAMLAAAMRYEPAKKLILNQ